MMRALVVLAACSAPAQHREASPTQPAPRIVLDPLSEASLVADLAWLVAPERAGRGSQTPEAQATARWIADELRAAGYEPRTQPIPSVPGQVNVIADHGSPDSSGVIVMAHYDHLGVIGGKIHPGADDNASGVAVALAVARAIRKSPTTGRVMFVFTGAEEIGLDGAKAFVADPAMPLDQIRAVYNLDMVGRHFFASTVDEDATLAAVGLPGNSDVFAAANDVATEVGLNLIPVRPGLVKILGEDRRSDDWILRDHGVYAIHFSTGLNDQYHTPDDTLARLSRPQLVRIAKFLHRLVVTTR
jgi:Zn-dependent M28 family amino/carboxypeptidase